jgi:hypothetical protein
MFPRMRILTVLSLSVVLAACGKSEVPDAGGGVDAGGTVDAGVVGPLCLADSEDAGNDDAGLDFSCLGRPRAPGGQAELVITGKATRAGFVRTPLAGVQLDLLTLDGTVLATTLSTDAGTYRLTYDAGCYPLDGEVRATHPPDDAGFALSYTVPDEPWRYDRKNLELVLFDASTSGLAAAIAGVMLVDGGAVLAMTVVDCLGNPVPGAIVSLAGPGDVRYVGLAGLPVTSQTSTAASGELVIFNIPGTSADVSATLDGGLIGQRRIPVHAAAATGTTLAP